MYTSIGSDTDTGGVYVLIIRVNSEVRAHVGRLGYLVFESGIYAYVGSAKRGFNGRISRHLRSGKKLFWHIDYLLSSEAVLIEEIWVSEKAEECELAGDLVSSGIFRFYRAKFGSSDCRCPSHLLRVIGDMDDARLAFSDEGLSPWKVID